ncbi:FAD-binding protein [Patescibacteria group bacterium]|nr:MAG: FAD-binding protein [Patescibacteria group bacterium]
MKQMLIQTKAPLAPYTSLRVGGDAETLVVCETYTDTLEAIKTSPSQPTLLGFGSNSLVSEAGLPGTTIVWRGGAIERHNNTLIVDAGVWWDDLVKFAIKEDLWGLELMSEIPSSVGGAIFGNIAAYGQQVSDTLEWIEVYNQETLAVEKRDASEFHFAYRESSLQSTPHLYILRASFALSASPLHTLRYESAITTANELQCDTDTLTGLREVIIETRRRAGSIYHPNDPQAERTAGSFFKNPLVTTEQAIELARFDETGKTLARIQEQSAIHGGSALRASAAHVLLAAGFSRGQTWGRVRLHNRHVLKIETLEGATASDVYTVAQEIISTVKEQLDITITPEVRFLGKFN